MKMLYFTHFTVFVVFYLFYFLSILPLAQITSCFFEEPKTAAVISNFILLIVIASWYLVRFLIFGIPLIPKWVHVVFNMISPIVFSEFIHQVAIAEKSQIPLNWTNLQTFSMEYNLLYGLIQLIVNFVIYMIVMWYFENIMPGADEQRPSPLFCFSFLCRKKPQIENSNSIELKELTKVFTNIWKCQRIVAVDNFDMKLDQNEIFALLGHNSAGKTTIINMLTGLLGPTSGSITVNGHNTMDSMDQIRSWLGVCPQESIVFEQLNAYEHLWLFGQIKGIPSDSLDKVITDLLDQVGLQRDAHQGKVDEFSGGMRRKLSIAMALIGDPKIIILDEPTTSLDAVSRRRIWKLLQERKKNRFIVLTTHSMEEADLLGDKIAIMKQGKLEACGTSLYLKNHFGVGYTLNCLVDPNHFDEKDVFDRICKIIPDATCKPRRGNEQLYILPYSQVASFPTVLKMLEKEKLGIKNYGLSVTTLEEVFLSI
jgi:ABC-type multidrug transport system ATPase subunit